MKDKKIIVILLLFVPLLVFNLNIGHADNEMLVSATDGVNINGEISNNEVIDNSAGETTVSEPILLNHAGIELL